MATRADNLPRHRTFRRIQSDTVWRDHGSINLDGLFDAKAIEQPCVSISYQNLSSTQPPRELESDDDEWNEWRAKDIPPIRSSRADPRESFTFLMCPRVNIESRLRTGCDRMALARMPVRSDRFESILTSLHIPDVFLDALVRPKGLFRHMKSSVDGQPCEVFILRIDSIFEHHTALCITYFPASKQVYGLYLGYNSREDVTDTTSRLIKNRAFINNPFVLIAAFLEIELKHRIEDVDDRMMEAAQRLQNSQWDCEGRGPKNLEANKTAGEQHLTQRFTLGVAKTRTHLRIWQNQLVKILTVCDAFPDFKPKDEGGFLLSPREYITNMVELFEDNILRCEDMLQIIGFSFQKELADAARRDAGTAISDAKQMKAIALLTMFFLPTTAVAGFMDAPIYEWGNTGKYWFWPITAVITGSVLLIYFWWVRLYGRVSSGRSQGQIGLTRIRK